jgi:hypothetical protein
LHNRREGLIFLVGGWNVLARQGILPGQAQVLPGPWSRPVFARSAY